MFFKPNSESQLFTSELLGDSYIEKSKNCVDNVKPKPERLNATEMHNKGEAARAGLKEELLDYCFEKINSAAECGFTQTDFRLDEMQYQGVASDVIDILNDMGYEVEECTLKGVEYQAGFKAACWQEVKISWGRKENMWPCSVG